jgi:hypothetical protein
MSIEAMYPSRNQSRAQNPLFSRELRRKRLVAMLALTTVGVSLLLLQLVPVKAHADNAVAQVKPATVVAEPVKQAAPAGKVVREIQIYNLRGTLN